MTYLHCTEKEIHILHLFESFYVYIKTYLSDPIVEENHVATSLFKIVSPKPFKYAFNINSLFPILQIISDD